MGRNDDLQGKLVSLLPHFLDVVQQVVEEQLHHVQLLLCPPGVCVWVCGGGGGGGGRRQLIYDTTGESGRGQEEGLAEAAVYEKT